MEEDTSTDGTTRNTIRDVDGNVVQARDFVGVAKSVENCHIVNGPVNVQGDLRMGG